MLYYGVLRGWILLSFILVSEGMSGASCSNDVLHDHVLLYVSIAAPRA